MQRRLIAAIAAVILAGIGAILLFNYVSSADARAMAGQEPTQVLVVTKDIPAGTLGKTLGGSATLTTIPRAAVAPGALTSLDGVADMATTVDLQPGEQLIQSRFAAPGTTVSGEVSIPNTMQIFSLQLETQRSVNGRLQAGDKVAVYASTADKIKQIVPGALVVGTKDDVITLAANPADVQKVILGMETGKIWLAEAAKDPTAVAPITVKQLVG